MRKVRGLFLICPRTRELLADWILSLGEILEEGFNVKKK
jgi:hypothetical protein